MAKRTFSFDQTTGVIIQEQVDFSLQTLTADISYTGAKIELELFVSLKTDIVTDGKQNKAGIDCISALMTIHTRTDKKKVISEKFLIIPTFPNTAMLPLQIWILDVTGLLIKERVDDMMTSPDGIIHQEGMIKEEVLLLAKHTDRLVARLRKDVKARKEMLATHVSPVLT